MASAFAIDAGNTFEKPVAPENNTAFLRNSLRVFIIINIDGLCYA
jgi:hypothetical protein